MNVIDDKKRKLRKEMEKEVPNKEIVRRLRESIERHKEELLRIKTAQRMRRHAERKRMRSVRGGRW